MSMYKVNRLLHQYNTNSTTIHNKLTQLPTLPTYNAQHKCSNDIQHQLYEQQELIESVVEQAHELSPADKPTVVSQLEQCKQQLEQQNARYTQYTELLSSGRTVPNSTNNTADTSVSSYQIDVNDIDDQYTSQRQALLGTKQLVDSTGDSLHRTKYVLAETTQIGSETHNQLLLQREQFLRQKDMLDDTNDFLGRSKKVLNRMRRRIVTNKLIQWLIIFLEVGLLLMIAYIKYWS